MRLDVDDIISYIMGVYRDFFLWEGGWEDEKKHQNTHVWPRAKNLTQSVKSAPDSQHTYSINIMMHIR